MMMVALTLIGAANASQTSSGGTGCRTPWPRAKDQQTGEGSTKVDRDQKNLGDQKITVAIKKYHLRCQAQCFVDLAVKISWV